MSYMDDLLEAAVTGAASGTRIGFVYREAMTSSVTKTNDSYRYVGLDGSEKRDNGNGPEEYPMQAVFKGDNHHKESEAFLTLLRERVSPFGFITLEHPRKGIKQVVVKGNINTTMDILKNAAQTTVDVIFEDQLIPPSQRREGALAAGRKQFDASLLNGQNDFATNTSLKKPSDILATKKSILDGIKKINSSVGSMLGKAADKRNEIDNIQADIINNIDTLVRTPAVLAAQMQYMVSAVLDLPATLIEKANAWRNLYAEMLSSDNPSTSPTSENKNVIATREMICGVAVASTAYNIIDSINEFETSQAAYDELMQTRQDLANMMTDFNVDEKNFETLEFQNKYFPNVSTYANMTAITSVAHQAIQQYVSGVKTSIVVTLAHRSCPLIICAKYYGDVSDETLFSFALKNKLSVSECFYLRAGRQLVI